MPENQEQKHNNKQLEEPDLVVKKPEAKPSPIAELLKFFLVIALVGFVGFFIVCSVQLGEIGH